MYKTLQHKIVVTSGFKGKDASLSARKVINQFVKIGFVYPLLIGYHPLVKKFLLETNREKKEIIFSKIFYEASSLASDVTLDNRDLKHVNFLLKTLDKNGSLNKNDIMALMVTDISNYKMGYLTREQLDMQYQYARANEFNERKYEKTLKTGGGFKQCFNDILGFRLKFEEYPREYPDYFRVVDLRNGKKIDDGYRAIHLYYQRDNMAYPIEIQLWCGKDYLFNIWSHQYIYKYKNPEIGYQLYRKYVDGKIKNKEEFLKNLKEMEGKRND